MTPSPREKKKKKSIKYENIYPLEIKEINSPCPAAYDKNKI